MKDVDRRGPTSAVNLLSLISASWLGSVESGLVSSQQQDKLPVQKRDFRERGEGRVLDSVTEFCVAEEVI